jgi:hypothetical protein
LLSHPLSQALVNYKWKKFGRFVYYSNMALYFLFVFFLTGYALATEPPAPKITNTATG